jgi:hypothetical protein
MPNAIFLTLMVRILLPQPVRAHAKRPDKAWYGFQLVGARKTGAFQGDAQK